MQNLFYGEVHLYKPAIIMYDVTRTAYELRVKLIIILH